MSTATVTINFSTEIYKLSETTASIDTLLNLLVSQKVLVINFIDIFEFLSIHPEYKGTLFVLLSNLLRSSKALLHVNLLTELKDDESESNLILEIVMNKNYSFSVMEKNNFIYDNLESLVQHPLIITDFYFREQ